MNSPRLLIAATAVATLATGCGAPRCLDATAYLDSAPSSALRIPAGVGTPGRAGDMRIPGGAPAGSGARVEEDGRCLAAPPEYYASASAANAEGLPLRPSEAAAASSRPGRGSGPVAGASLVTQEVAAFLERWADAWSRRDVEAWLGFYSNDYAPAGYASHQAWRDAQVPRFDVPAVTAVEEEGLDVTTDGEGRARARFVQRFGQPPEVRRVVKEVVLVPAPATGDWRIVDERIVDIL